MNTILLKYPSYAGSWAENLLTFSRLHLHIPGPLEDPAPPAVLPLQAGPLHHRPLVGPAGGGHQGHRARGGDHGGAAHRRGAPAVHGAGVPGVPGGGGRRGEVRAVRVAALLGGVRERAAASAGVRVAGAVPAQAQVSWMKNISLFACNLTRILQVSHQRPCMESRI